MKIKARWIWTREADPTLYNRTIVARRTFTCGDVRTARMAITADSAYRLKINDEWVNDGPCRAWPEHFQYDELDVTGYLRSGRNTIEVVARWFGTGTMHQVPRHPGLLAQLEITPRRGRRQTLCTDAEWRVAPAHAWTPHTPKIALQAEPCEEYDARRERLRFESATELFAADRGPWGDLQPRDVGLLTRQPFDPRVFRSATLVQSDWMAFTFPLWRLKYPGTIECNASPTLACAAATVVHSSKDRTIEMETWPVNAARLSVNGRGTGRGGRWRLRRGANLVLLLGPVWGHTKEMGLRFATTRGFRLENPIDAHHDNPWVFVPLHDLDYIDNDMTFLWASTPARTEAYRRVETTYARLTREVVDVASFREALGAEAQLMPPADMWSSDVHAQFMRREPLADASDLVERPAALMHDHAEWTTVRPSPGGDVELCYDLGEQNIGYYDFEIDAEAGTVVDIFGVEYIKTNGTIQHTEANRNGLRYVCRGGPQRFTSLRRRSGRYLFLTLRNQSAPVRIRRLSLIESTYPVHYRGRFECSDANLTRVWEISNRTLKLCMEDTLTDCPLYEQTLWVGDARNEGLYALTSFGAEDMIRRCIRLAGESLERYPMVGCQVPSGWDCILPVWSFLWGISVWDYYFYSGDKAWLTNVWGQVKRNLRGAERMTDEAHGALFSAPYWNMFDWSGLDDQKTTVLHNSLFLVGAIDAARRCARELGDAKTNRWLAGWRRRLVAAVNALWDDEKQAYPDALDDDGTPSDKISTHTSFLALLYDVVEDPNRPAALANALAPREGMTRVGSPFAIQYLYETFEKTNHPDAILDSILANYLPMLREGATTVWEVLPGTAFSPGEFPSRSHCHAWSSAPIDFLNRIWLGIRPTAVGGAAYAISPRVDRMTWASGASAGARGNVEVQWRREGDTVTITAQAPEGVRLRFTRNDTHDGLAVVFNGRRV